MRRSSTSVWSQGSGTCGSRSRSGTRGCLPGVALEWSPTEISRRRSTGHERACERRSQESDRRGPPTGGREGPVIGAPRRSNRAASATRTESPTGALSARRPTTVRRLTPMTRPVLIIASGAMLALRRRHLRVRGEPTSASSTSAIAPLKAVVLPRRGRGDRTPRPVRARPTAARSGEAHRPEDQRLLRALPAP